MSTSENDSYSDWDSVSGHRWSVPRLRVGAVAETLGVDPLLDIGASAPGLSPPFHDEILGCELWSLGQVYDFILVHRPELIDKVERLYPFTSALGPARFLFGEIRGSFAVHAWQPTDGRGPIAVAYSGAAANDSDLPVHAAALLDELPWATAVCFPDELGQRAPDGQQQPRVVVVEPPRAGAADPLVFNDYAWFDIVGLLRVDLPWWSKYLRDFNAIAAWEPGTPVQQLRAWPGNTAPDRLYGLQTPNTPEYVAAVIGRAVTYLDHKLRHDAQFDRNAGHDGFVARQGLRQAAVAAPEPAPPPDSALTFSEAALLLHQPCNDESVAKACRELLLKALEDRNPIRGSTSIARSTDNPLAVEWIARLEDAVDADELGFWIVRVINALDANECTMHRDPLNPHCWVVKTADTVYASAAQSVPATGQLSEVAFDGPSQAFFRDSTGTPWPWPVDGTGYPSCGPQGGDAGHQRLTEQIANLVFDAGINLGQRVIPYDRDSALAKLVAVTPPRLSIRPNDPVLAITLPT
ncbi:hypothetical protein A5722_01195 [Mycobacterium vulneris]|uniref:hypothetical protein n=1 Tax=Mycolicibacterium fortuitum TaxID=1766 RepID=UPI0004135AA9|nr:hypothetical protein [Mycolicibacterium fortuitum]MBX8690610.1 hypothetical protein [Mycobacterium sp. 20091114027_K0903767]MCP3810863.1 hypothetical protein [Mycobacteriaceae bacterium Msp059]OCB48618.1 hypothetical protein A5721_04490 [Mycolicibacterium vulneris]OBK04822.1 hypothetical protein A5637_11560 [Mycolicibacterium fortuitum]OBK62730.1 hypothetical protein A5654_25480 [Mycolicibacterium fortuitum]